MKLFFLLIALLSPVQESTSKFAISTRLVEVYANVVDSRNRPVLDLKQDVFAITDGGKTQKLESFGSSADSVTLAILLDTTGSMRDVMPVLKNATSLLIDQLREQDTVAIYGFSNGIERIQDFTQEKRAAKLAVRRLRAEGKTALFDSLARVAQDLTARPGKRAIVVFTDGDDNSSVLNLESAVMRARKTGVPVYAVAQGEALASSRLMKHLEQLSESTGGKLFKAARSSEMEDIFVAIAADLRSIYLLTYYAPPSKKNEYRQIQVTISNPKGLRIRCREGYFAD